MEILLITIGAVLLVLDVVMDYFDNNFYSDYFSGFVGGFGIGLIFVGAIVLYI